MAEINEIVEEKQLERKTREYVRLIPIETIFPGELFVRTEYDPAAFRFLCASISRHGIIEPLIVVRYMSGYRIISGDRRYYAAKHCKMSRLPCIVRNDAPRALELTMKMSAKGLSPFDLAEAIKSLGGAEAAAGLFIKKQEAESLMSLLDFTLRERIVAESAGLGKDVLFELLKIQNRSKRAKLLEKAAKESLSPSEIRRLAGQKRRIRGTADVRLIANSAKKLCADFEALGIPLDIEVKKDCVTIKKAARR